MSREIEQEGVYSAPENMWIYLIISLVLVVCSAYFSATETAFSSLNKYRFKVKADSGSRTAKLVLKIHDNFDKTLVTILIGNNLTAVILSSLFTFLFASFMWPLDEGIISLIASIILTAIVYLFGETIPKQIAKRIPDKVAEMTAYLLFFFLIIFFPFSWIFSLVAKGSKKAFKGKEEATLTEEEFTEAVSKNEEHGLLESNESDIIQNSFDFADTFVQDVLTPKRKMYMINLKDLKTRSLVEILSKTNYSRIPCYVGNQDSIVGVLLVKEFLANYLLNPETPITASLQKPYIVSPRITMNSLSDGFRKNHTQVAIVKKGEKLVGMVTMEDVLEELVGDIHEKNIVERSNTL